MLRKAKLNNGLVVQYDMCSRDEIPNNKQKQLVLLGVGVIDTINGISQNSEDEMFFYSYKNRFMLHKKIESFEIQGRYLNIRDYRIETFLKMEDKMIVTDHQKVHEDYFREFYQQIGMVM